MREQKEQGLQPRTKQEQHLPIRHAGRPADFAAQNVSRMMRGEACPADGCGTRSFRVESWSDRLRSGTASSGLIFTSSTFKI